MSYGVLEMKRAILALLLTAAAGCAMAVVPMPDAMMAGNDDARLGDLKQGRDLYINKCSGCHSLFSVDQFDDAKWVSEVNEMIRLKKIRLDPADRDNLLLYLTTANGR
jgi:hypothetical protein